MMQLSPSLPPLAAAELKTLEFMLKVISDPKAAREQVQVITEHTKALREQLEAMQAEMTRLVELQSKFDADRRAFEQEKADLEPRFAELHKREKDVRAHAVAQRE